MKRVQRPWRYLPLDELFSAVTSTSIQPLDAQTHHLLDHRRMGR